MKPCRSVKAVSKAARSGWGRLSSLCTNSETKARKALPRGSVSARGTTSVTVTVIWGISGAPPVAPAPGGTAPAGGAWPAARAWMVAAAWSSAACTCASTCVSICAWSWAASAVSVCATVALAAEEVSTSGASVGAAPSTIAP